MSTGSFSSAFRKELSLARQEIRRGRFERTMAVIAAFSALVSGFEAYVQHQRGAFRNRWMWTPVGLVPPVVLAAGAALVSRKAAHRALPIVSLASLVDGAIGFFYHLRGIARLPGGYRLGQYNIVMGPPIFAPLLMSIVGILGLLASWLRPERLEDLKPEKRETKKTESRETRIEKTFSAQSKGDPLRELEGSVSHGQFQKLMAIISAFLAVLSGGEAYFEHTRGSYNQRWMWTPVWVTAPMLAAAVGAVRSEKVARTVLPWTSALAFLDGLLGFWLHVRGIRRMPGGLSNLRFNLTMGPPLFAPLLFSAVGLLGFTASLLGRRHGRGN